MTNCGADDKNKTASVHSQLPWRFSRVNTEELEFHFQLSLSLCVATVQNSADLCC